MARTLDHPAGTIIGAQPWILVSGSSGIDWARPRFVPSRMGRPRQLRHSKDFAVLDDDVLVAHLADSGALAELISRHQGRLFVMAHSMIRNRSDAEEIVQDTFVQAFRSAASFRSESKVSTWLHAICYRQVLTRTRRKRHLTVALERTAEQPVEAANDSFRLALEAALQQLPEPNRQAFLLVDQLGFSRAEAAQIVGIEANTMRARVARARLLLADLLTDGEDD